MSNFRISPADGHVKPEGSLESVLPGLSAPVGFDVSLQKSSGALSAAESFFSC
jgi:hypothetical protein